MLGFFTNKLVSTVLGSALVAVLSYWAYDYIHIKPARDVKRAYEQKITELTEETYLKEEALQHAGAKLTECAEALQAYRDRQKRDELESLYRTIDKTVEESDDENGSFDLYQYIF